MKKKIISTVLSAAMIAGSVCFGSMGKVNAAGVAINESNFPDPVFRNYIEDKFDLDSDKMLSQDEIDIASIINLGFSEEPLYSVEGVKYFTSLEELNVASTDVTNVDVSGLQDIYLVNVMFCEDLKTLNVNNCPELIGLLATDTSLTTIDVSTNTKLVLLGIDGNPQLKMPDLSNNTSLKEIDIGGNGYTDIDLSKFPDLIVFEGFGNNFKSLDISNNKYLINVYENGLTREKSAYDFNGNHFPAIEYYFDPLEDSESAIGRLLIDTGIELIVNGSSVPVPTSTPAATSTPAPTSTPAATSTPRPTVGAIPTAAPTAAAKQNVGDFVNRCYSVALGRDADSDGFNYWKNKLVNGEACGAQVGYGFIFSGEYISKNKSNEDFIKDLYSMYFGRTPDQAGYDYWLNKLNSGETREKVFAGFANSLEFYNLCEEYGVVSGYYAVGVDNDRQGGINCFVARLYKTCLNRLPDIGSQALWVEKLLNNEVTGTQVAYSFAFSPEFIQMNLSREGYVAYMYRAFFGREADTAGFEGWVNRMIDGASNEEVFDGFTGSIEFDALCQSYGIAR